MAIALIDHFDSFTYNIYELIRKTGRSDVEVIPANALNLNDLANFEKIILSPGPGVPSDFLHIKDILDNYKQTKHILGICLGHQAISLYFGAKLINLEQVVHGQTRKIKVLTSDPLFKNMSSEFEVGLYHSWVVSEANFPNQLKITSQSVHNKLIMSIQHREFHIFGVQFHPESHLTSNGKQIMENFLSL